MMRNKYITTEETVEELSKREIDHYFYSSEDVDKIEDLELEGESNVLIYKNNYGDGEEFINIYGGVKIMMTTRYTIDEDKYLKLPENIEYVIVEKRIYEVRDESQMSKFMKEERFEEYVRRMMEEGRENEMDKNGDTILMKVIEYGKEEIVRELMKRMSEEAINGCNKYGETALFYACSSKIDESIIIEMMRRMDDEMIKRSNNEGKTALHEACYYNKGEVALEMIERMTDDTINRWDKEGKTALSYACLCNMGRVALKLIPRMAEGNINMAGNLIWACDNKMEEVAMELIPRMSVEVIKTRMYKKDAKKIARKKGMMRVVEMIEERER